MELKTNKLAAGLSLAAAGLTAAAPNTQMLPIPAGSYQRSDGTTVTVNAFSMLSTEVTWSQYKTVRDWAEQHGYDFEEGIGQADLPAQNICWYDAVKWCNALSEMTGKNPAYQSGGKVYRTGRAELVNADVKWDADGYRLPTEAEWEYAYRAGTTTSLYWGQYPREGAPVNHEYAAFHIWGTSEIDGGPLPVGSKKPNAFGLYDMAGNVEEWVWDRYAIGYNGVGADNPHGPDSGPLRVLRGGGFVIDRLFTADTRHPTYPFWINCDIGFRVASSDPKATATELAAIASLPLAPNDITPFTEPRTVLDVRENTDEAACARLTPFLDLDHPNLSSVRTAYEAGDHAAALVALRDLYVPRLKALDIEPVHAPWFNSQAVNKWLDVYREKRPIRWAGAETDMDGPWGFSPSSDLAKARAKDGQQEHADAYFWMLNEVVLHSKPFWNRLTKAEKGSKGNPRDCFYASIGFDAGHPLPPFVDIAWMLKHGLPEQDVPPRTLADTLHWAVVDRLAAGLQDDRGNVPNQVWGNAIAIVEFNQLFPELKDAAFLRAEGIHRLRNAMGTVMPDGTDLEPSLNYNARLFSDREKINRLLPDREQWPDWLVEFNRRADYRHYMYASLATPFGTYPSIGNQSPTDLRPRKALQDRLADGTLQGMAHALNQLLEPSITKARKLPPSPFTSVGLPHGGYYVQRSGWTAQDHYLFLRSSRDVVGHNHHDNNNVQVAAHGAWLLIDSGSPAYGARFLPDHQKKYEHYFGEPGLGNVFMASCLSVDGLWQGKPVEQLPGPTAGWETPRKNLLHHSDAFDVTEGVYDGWYDSEPPISDKGIQDLLNDHGPDEIAEILAYNTRLKHDGDRRLHAVHRRLVVFLRSEKLWVLVDEVDGGTEFTQTWNFPPPDEGLNDKVDCCPGYSPGQVRADEAGKRIVTISHYRPNLAILNFISTPVRYTQHYGDKFPFRGWHSFGIGGEKVPAVQMEGSWRGDAPMVTVLLPSKARPDRARTLDWGLTGLVPRNSDSVSGFAFADKKTTVTVQASRSAQPLAAGPVTATATLLVVREDGKGGLAGIALGCTALTVNGTVFDSSGENLQFVLTPDTRNLTPVFTPILPPETFRWADNSKGQLVPRYRNGNDEGNGKHGE